MSHWKSRDEMSEEERALDDCLRQGVPQEELADIHNFGDLFYNQAVEVAMNTLISASASSKQEIYAMLCAAAMGGAYSYRALVCEVSPQVVDQVDHLLAERYGDKE